MKIAIVPGDGIGPEVINEGLKVLDVIKNKLNLSLELEHKDWGADTWLKTGVGLPKDALADLSENYDAIYFGALGDPRIPDMAHGREILLGLRFGLDLYVNMRPISMFSSSLCPLKKDKDIDFMVFRENTEDLYVSVGGNFKMGTNDEVAIDESIHTKKGVERIVRYAFEHAQKSGRRKITLADKANAIRFGGSLWQRVFRAVGVEYPAIKTEHLYVDVMAMELVKRPQDFDIIVTSNLFGDILSDLGAGLVGGLGLAASGNIHPGRIGLFEPVHGSAPDIADKGEANPIAAILTLGMMLDYLGEAKPKIAIEKAIGSAFEEGALTPDLGGTLSTTGMGNFVCERLNLGL